MDRRERLGQPGQLELSGGRFGGGRVLGGGRLLERPAGGDWGDNVIYPRVRVGAGAHNTLSYQTICKKWGWYTYRGVVGQRSLTPYKSGLSYTY